MFSFERLLDKSTIVMGTHFTFKASTMKGIIETNPIKCLCTLAKMVWPGRSKMFDAQKHANRVEANCNQNKNSNRQSETK